MSIGLVSISTNAKREQVTGPPFALTAADNGLSVDPVTGRVVFGNSVGAVGSPAALLNSREILAGAFTARLINVAVAPTNILTLGAGTIGITTLNAQVPVLFTHAITNDTILGSGFAQTTLTFDPVFINSLSFNAAQVFRVRFATVNGTILTTSLNLPKPAVYGAMDFRNVAPATPNAITIAGTGVLSVFYSKTDLANSANNNKTITGTIAGYATLLDMGNGLVGSLTSYIDFLAGTLVVPTAAFSVTNRYGFFCKTLLSGTAATNRWGFYQEGVADRNYFAGFSGFATPTDIPTARVHIGAGTAAAGTALMKFTQGVVLTATEAGAWEWNGTNVFFTNAAAVRQNVLTGNDAGAAPATSVGVAIINFYGTAATNFLGDPNSWASVTINGTAYKIPLYT